MAKKIKEATKDLEMESEEDSLPQDTEDTNILQFHPAIWDMYGPDVDNIITAVQMISLQIQTVEGSEEYQKLKQNNDNFITTKIWDALCTSRGPMTQLKLEYLTELGNNLDKLKEELDKCSSGEEDMKKPPMKFSNPDTFPNVCGT